MQASEALRRSLEVLEERPSALVTDIDGTISRIVLRPEDATVSERARGSLHALSEALDLVGVVTARQQDVARQMVGLDELTYVGSYALDEDAASRLREGGLDGARQQVSALLERLPCVEIEDKGISFSVHYRRCADAGVRRPLLSLLQPVAEASAARLVEGKRVIEMVPAWLPHKGTAFERLLDDHAVRGAIFLGDDASDVAIFQSIAWRRARGLPGLSIAVIDAETEDFVREAGDITLAGVDGVEAYLEALAQYLVEANS